MSNSSRKLPELRSRIHNIRGRCCIQLLSCRGTHEAENNRVSASIYRKPHSILDGDGRTSRNLPASESFQSRRLCDRVKGMSSGSSRPVVPTTIQEVLHLERSGRLKCRRHPHELTALISRWRILARNMLAPGLCGKSPRMGNARTKRFPASGHACGKGRALLTLSHTQRKLKRDSRMRCAATAVDTFDAVALAELA